MTTPTSLPKDHHQRNGWVSVRQRNRDSSAQSDVHAPVSAHLSPRSPRFPFSIPRCTCRIDHHRTGLIACGQDLRIFRSWEARTSDGSRGSIAVVFGLTKSAHSKAQ
ncbi:hypothetical protein EMPS_11570 [Entomortierella parvispora]|uniref:Uncharacterized protein n=1 Tax=Entomortierella parvispora TaxID=205924 RepID=A0A9P3M226_9FUNG|nr:hypothetical protein EMPS_11570 [Entomortierella parvispora]